MPGRKDDAIAVEQAILDKDVDFSKQNSDFFEIEIAYFKRDGAPLPGADLRPSVRAEGSDGTQSINCPMSRLSFPSGRKERMNL